MDSEIAAQIRECEARLYQVMAVSDGSALDLLIADDLLFVGPTGELATKAMDLELHRIGATQFHEFAPKELDIRVWSEQFGLAVAKIVLSGTSLGNSWAGNYRYTRVWRQGKSGWQVMGSSVSAMG